MHLGRSKEMSKSKVVSSEKPSGAHLFKDKGHEKSKHPQGAHDTKKHESPLKEQGAHERKAKPQVHVEDVNHHSGRPHPPATVLSDSKLLGHNAYGGKLRKSDEGKSKK
jgi:hypothetical protein